MRPKPNNFSNITSDSELERGAMNVYYNTLWELDEAYKKKHPFKHWLYSGSDLRIPIFSCSITGVFISIILYFIYK